MERRLNEVEWSPSSAANNQEQVNNEEAGGGGQVGDKDRIIRSLESEVEAQVNAYVKK